MVILMYMVGHTCPYIYYAVICSSWYIFEPNRLHELALKRIGRYFKEIMKKGLVLNPSPLMCNIFCLPEE